MKTIKHILLYSLIGFGFLFGSFSSAQIVFPDEEEPALFDVIESVNGANVKLNDTVVANRIGQPMFHRYGQLLNVAITFFPVVFVVSAFWFIYGVIKNLGHKKDLDNKKSLDNR